MTAPYVEMIRQLNRELNTELVTELRYENTRLHKEIDRLLTILAEQGICDGCGRDRGYCQPVDDDSRCCGDCTHWPTP